MEATDYFRKSAPAIFRLETYLPTSTIKKRNPLFDRQIRTLRWPRGLRPDELNTAEAREIQAAKIRGLKRYTRRYGLIVPMLCACVGAAILSRPYYVSMWFGLFLLYGPIGLSLLCNLYYAVTAVNRITHQSTMEQWELLRLTKLTERDILQANYATIQVRAWRLAVIEAEITGTTGYDIYAGYDDIASARIRLFSGTALAYACRNPDRHDLCGLAGWLCHSHHRIPRWTGEFATLASWYIDWVHMVV